MIGIYRIYNKINNKSYIGQSVNIEKRIKTHFWAAFKDNLPSYNFHIYQAIRKYGIDNFDYEILETISTPDIQKLNELEIKYISLYDSYYNGYNMTSGGDNSEQNINSGERNGKAKLTEQDIRDIREAYNNHQLKRNVYELYKDRVGESGFDKIWNWRTWKNILPEYHNEENIKWYSTIGKGLSSEQASLNAGKIDKITIYQIRELFSEGITPEEIVKLLDLQIQPKEVKRIGIKKRFSAI